MQVAVRGLTKMLAKQSRQPNREIAVDCQGRTKTADFRKVRPPSQQAQDTFIQKHVFRHNWKPNAIQAFSEKSRGVVSASFVQGFSFRVRIGSLVFKLPVVWV